MIQNRCRAAALSAALGAIALAAISACAGQPAADRCLYWTEAEYGRHTFWGSCVNPPPDASPVIPSVLPQKFGSEFLG